MITREADYAVRLVQYLADKFDTEQLIPITEISEQMQIPYRHLRLVGTKLSAAGLVTSRRGNNGGYKLNRHPSEISLLDVIHSIDNKCLLMNLCLHPNESCHRSTRCKVHACLQNLQNNLNQSLSAITFEQLSQQS